MQHVQPAGASLDSYATRASRIAWTVVLSAFTICCLTIGSLGYAGWRYYIDATLQKQATLIVRTEVADSITWTPAGSAQPTAAHNDQALKEGGEVRISRTGGSSYGQAASVELFDRTRLDLWAGSDITLQTLRTSRWSQRYQEVTIVQKDGYVRYDLQGGQPYQSVRYTVLVSGVEVALAPGGSYSIDIPDRVVQARSDAPTVPTTADIAVRAGQLQVQGASRSVTVLPGQRVTIDTTGQPSAAMDAHWELIQDGKFLTFDEKQYNNTTVLQQTGMPPLPRADTWQVTSIKSGDDVADGYFSLNQKCLPLGSPNNCEHSKAVNVANFHRCCDTTTGFLTGVRQQIAADVSEYRSLRLSLWLRVLNQSLNGAGDAGVECPATVKLIYKQTSPDQNEQNKIWCLYVQDQPVTRALDAALIPQPVKKYEWYHLDVELRNQDLLPNARYLQEIQVYANGHDYNTEVTNVSLIGTQ